MSTPDSDQPTAADELNPEIAGLLQQMGGGPNPPFASLSSEGMREFVAGMFPSEDEPEPVGDTMDLKIAGESGEVPIRVYVPESEGLHPALVYVHGGGWVTGSIDEFDATCRALVNATDRLVVSVEYGLSPEHKFPKGMLDSYSAVKWIQENAESMQVQADDVTVAGDSSGGNLVAGLTLLARDRGEPDISRQILIYPVVSTEFERKSYQEFGEGYLLTEADLKHFWNMYLRDDIDAGNKYAVPLHAEDLSNLPPTSIFTCGYDPLRDEGYEYATRLEEAGIDITYENYDDCIHGIAQMIVDPINLGRAQDLVDDIANDL
jgi:acetyl esterase